MENNPGESDDQYSATIQRLEAKVLELDKTIHELELKKMLTTIELEELDAENEMLLHFAAEFESLIIQ